MGVCGKDCVVIAAEKKSIPVLQDPRTNRKIYQLDDHVLSTFAGECDIISLVSLEIISLVVSNSSAKQEYGFFIEGLNADARVLVNMAREHCQNFKLNNEDPVTVEHITKNVAHTKQVHEVKALCRLTTKLLPKFVFMSADTFFANTPIFLF